MRMYRFLCIVAMISVFSALPVSGRFTSAQTAECDGFDAYEQEMFVAGLAFVADLDANGVGPLGNLQEFSSADWTAFAEVNLRFQDALSTVTPPSWATHWHEATVSRYGLISEVSTAATKDGYGVVESFKTRLENLNLQMTESSALASDSCESFREFTENWYLLTTLGQISVAASPVPEVIPAGVISYAYVVGQHDDSFNAWTEVPPVGGFHNSVWQKCGFYDGKIVTGMGVHSMEHGAVWATYSPSLGPSELLLLKELAESQDYLLVTMFPDLPAPIVISSWNKQIYLESADDPALQQFIAVFKNSPKYTPEFGATCDNGSTATVPRPPRR